MKRVTVAVICVALCLGSLAYAQRLWYSAYQEGLQAIQRQDWARAEQLLLEARKNGPRPGRRVLFYGSPRRDFLPDFYLGIALFNQNRREEARVFLELLAASNLVRPADREYEQLHALLRSTALVGSAEPAATKANVVPAIEALPEPVSMPGVPLERHATDSAPGIGPPTHTPTGSDEERTGIRAFLRGRYSAAVSELTRLAYSGTLSPRGRLFLACSYAALAIIDDSTAERVELARAHYRQAMEGGVRPDRRLVSPRIITLLEGSDIALGGVMSMNRLIFAGVWSLGRLSSGLRPEKRITIHDS
jgi:tetratricopeptide (TPR) repeat protein